MTYTPVLAAFGGDFFTLFPTYLTKVSAFRNAIMLVGLVLSFAALLFSAYKAQYGNIAQLWRTLIAIAIVAIALTPFGFEDWIIKLAGATDNFVTTELGVDPATIPDKLWTYFKSDGSGGSKGFWDYLLDAHTAIIEMFMWGIVWLSSQCAILIKWWANFIQTALVYASQYQCYVVLKGFQTIIATPASDLFINNTGNPGMATGGTGDILSGMMGRFVAGWKHQIDIGNSCDLADYISGAVYCHGLAGDLAAEEKGMESLIATDLLAQLPQAFKNIYSL